jgi:hypothetical protein
VKQDILQFGDMEKNEIKKTIEEYNPDALFIDGLDGDEDAFDDALIGIGNRCGLTGLAIYDSQKVIDILVEKYDLSYEDAVEWYDYNILGGYHGEYTPLFVDDLRKM